MRHKNIVEKIVDEILSILRIEKNAILGIAAEAVYVSILMLIALALAVVLTLVNKL